MLLDNENELASRITSNSRAPLPPPPGFEAESEVEADADATPIRHPHDDVLLGNDDFVEVGSVTVEDHLPGHELLQQLTPTG